MRIKRISGVVCDELKAHGVTGNCTLCGSYAEAMWMGSGGPVEVCHECATTALPALIGDATIGVPSTHPHLVDYARRVLAEVAASFWKSIVSRLLAEARNAKAAAEVTVTETEVPAT